MKILNLKDIPLQPISFHKKTLIKSDKDEFPQIKTRIRSHYSKTKKKCVGTSIFK